MPINARSTPSEGHNQRHAKKDDHDQGATASQKAARAYPHVMAQSAGVTMQTSELRPTDNTRNRANAICTVPSFNVIPGWCAAADQSAFCPPA